MIYYLVIFEYSIHIKFKKKIKLDILSCNLRGFCIHKIKKSEK